MRRMFLILAATALMVVLMATTVSPAFATKNSGNGSDNNGAGWGNVQTTPEGKKFDGHEIGDPNGWWYVYGCSYGGPNSCK
jgi:hypothetical protein